MYLLWQSELVRFHLLKIPFWSSIFRRRSIEIGPEPPSVVTKICESRNEKNKKKGHFHSPRRHNECIWSRSTRIRPSTSSRRLSTAGYPGFSSNFGYGPAVPFSVPQSLENVRAGRVGAEKEAHPTSFLPPTSHPKCRRVTMQRSIRLLKITSTSTYWKAFARWLSSFQLIFHNLLHFFPRGTQLRAAESHVQKIYGAAFWQICCYM